MEQQEFTNQTNTNNLPNASLVLTLSIISIVTGCFIATSFVGIILSVIALILGDKAQNVYLTNPNPSAWSNFSTLTNGMVCAIIGFVINAFIMAYLLDYSITQLMKEIKTNTF